MSFMQFYLENGPRRVNRTPLQGERQHLPSQSTTSASSRHKRSRVDFGVQAGVFRRTRFRLWHLISSSFRKPSLLMGISFDVTEQKQQEEIRRESEKRFRLVADSAPVLIWMSGADKLCTFFNLGWLKFTGRTLEQELGNGWASGVHPDDLERCMAVYTASFDARVGFEMEYRLRHYDGEYHWVIDHGVPRFECDGTFCGYIGSCIDITERKLSDDFSQRLALLGIGLGQLLKTLPKSDVEKRAHVLEMLKGTKELSSDLHALSRQLHSSRLDHVGLVSALGGLCREISGKHKIEVQFIECNLPLEIP